MSKTSKRVLSWVMTVLMVVSMLSSFAIPAAFAADAKATGPDVANAYYVSHTFTSGNVSFKWEGKTVNGTVGTNAFATIDAAIQAAKAKGNTCPDIIVPAWNNSNLTITGGCRIYAPNWNTVPYLRDTQDGTWKAVNSNGANWTENPDYFDSQVTINNLIIEGTASGVVEVYGFTQIDGIFAGGNTTKRTTSSPKIDILVKNGVGKCNVTTKNGGSFFKTYNNNSRNQDDSLTLENFYFKWIRTGGDSRLFGDQNMPAHVTLDGVWMDYDTCGFLRHDFTKTSGKNSSITIKNSNIRNTGKNHTGTNSNGSAYNRWNYICFGAFLSNPVLGTDGTLTNDITFENNVFYNANNTDSATNLALFHLDETGVGSLTIKDNYAINTSGTLAKVLNKRMGSANNVIGDGDVKIEGNKFLGYYDNFTQPDDKKEAIDNNFVVSQPLTSVDAYKTAVGNELKADTGLADGSTGAYYLDYNMKYISSDFALDIKIGEDDQITVDGNEIIANVKQGGASVTPSIKAKGADVAVKISTKSDFSDTVTTFDTSVKESVATYYVRAYSKTDANVYMDYVLTVAVEKSKEVIEFESENAYIINKDWSDEQLAGDADLTIWFNGKDRTVNPKTDKLFNSFDKAHDAAFATLTAENYFTLNPIFVFGPGDYSGSIIHIPANATIYGSNAGISPNAKNPADATIDSIKADGGIAANPDFNLDKATKLGAVMFTTRIDDGTGTKWNVVDVSTEAGVKWQGARDAALKANSTAELTLVIDGILQGGNISMSGFDTNQKYTYKGTANIAPVQGRVNEIILKNSKVTKNNPIGAWNTTWHYNYFTFDSVRTDVNIDDWGDRFFDAVNFKNSYFTKLTSGGALTKLWMDHTSSNRRAAATLNIDDCVFFDCTNQTFYFDVDRLHDGMTTLTFNLTDSVLYNAGTANWGYIQMYNREDFNRTLNVNVIGNEIYHDKNSNTLFNGNVNYMTKGKNNITFTENKVIGTLSNVAPNMNYSDATMKELFSHNFNNNFFATAKDAVAKVPGIADGGFPNLPNSGYTANPDWNYNDPIYYLDFDFKYKNTDAAVTALNAGSGNLVDLQPKMITANILSKTGVIDASSFTVGANNTVTIKDGSTAVSSIDLTKVSGVKDYTVLVGIKGEAANIARTYTLRVIDGAVDFNAALKNGGITYGDKTFTAANTVAFAPSGQATYTDKNGLKYFYQYFNGTLYKYTIDNENVFAWATKNITLNSINRRSTEGSQNADGTWNWSRPGLDLDKVKDKAENGNIILAGENFTASSAQLIIPYATSIYGLNAGVNPVNKASATAANDYKASLTAEWGQHGQTKIGTVRIGNAKDGDIVIDGITLTERVYDTVRYEMYNSKDEALNVTFENIVIDTPAAAGSIFNINNALTTNGSGAGGGDGAGSLPITEAGKEFGKIYNDSFTLENCYIKSSATNHVFDEQIPANVTVRNYYEDCSTSGRVRNLFGFMKTGAYNMISNITIEDSIIRGNATQLTNRIFHSEGPRNPVSGFDYGVNITIRNNVFFKSAGTGYICVVPAHVDNLAIVNNIFVADTTMNVYENQGGAKDIANVTISDNRYVGFADANISHTAMEANLTEVNGFATTDANAYKNANGYTGYQAAAFGTNDYYVNFGMTAKASEFAITKFEAGTSDIKDITVDADNRKIQFSLARGTTEGISVVLAGDNAKWFFSTDADGKNKINVISREDLRQLVSTYYFNIESNGVVLTYEMEILNDIVPDFAEVEGLDPAYFSNDAVIVTDKAANLAVGTEIFEQWDGQWYRFYAGVNAFATLEDALKIDAEVAEVLITELVGDKYDVSKGSDQADISLTRSAKLFGPNYKTPAVVTDGFGYNSPSKGQAWGLNPAFVEKMDLVKFKTLSIQENAIVVEAYGLTIDRGVYDRYKAVGADSSIKLVNTYFTNDNPTSNSFIFSYSIGKNNNNVDTVGTDGIAFNENNNSTLYVKNAYFDQVESGLKVRIIGENEVSVANTTFEEIYLDASDEVGLGGNGNWLKAGAKNNAFTIKNSYLANWTETDFQFKGYTNTSGSPVDIPEGYSNALTFDNNIFYNFAGHNDVTNSRAALIKYNSRGFSEVNITNNYIVPVIDRTEIRCMFWDTSAIGSNEIRYAITGNVINGLIGGIYSGSGNTYNPNAHWDVSDNFVVTAYNENLDGVIGRSYTTNPTYKTMKYDWYRLSADGTLRSCDIQDMTWSDRVTFSGTTAIANIYDCDNIYTVTENANADDPSVIDSYTYKFDLSSLVKANKYGNRISVSYNGGEAVDLTKGKLEITRDTKIAPDTAIRVTVTVDSPDGRAEDVVYTFVIFMNSGDAPAFKGTFKDDANIIKDTAVIVTPAAAGATGTINAQWLGETYSFTVGENAFATVEDALAAAKAANAEYAEIILPENTTAIDVLVSHPAKIYGVNYNTMPYTADGYGTESPSLGANWSENAGYFNKQTKIHSIAITDTMDGGVFELHGITVTGKLFDEKRVAGENVDILYNNVAFDIANNNAPAGYTVAGNNGRYIFRLVNAANKASLDNSFTVKNSYVKNLNGGVRTPFMGEDIAPVTVYDGLYMNLDKCNYTEASPAYMKSIIDGSSLTIKNSNFYSSTAKHLFIFNQIGGRNFSAAVNYENNIFNNVYANKDSGGNPYYFNYYASDDNNQKVTIKGNYFGCDFAGKTMFFFYSNSVGDGKVPVEITNNVFNGTRESILLAVGNTAFVTTPMDVYGNYAVYDYVPNIQNSNVTGESLVVDSKNVSGDKTYFALDYDRTLMSNEVGDVEIVDGKNILIDTENKTVTYAYNELVTKNASNAITVDLTAFTTLTNKYNSVVAVLSDGTEKDLSTIFTYDGATLGETLTLKVYSYDKSASKTTYTVTFVEGAHAMGDWVPYTEAGCGTNATEIQRCNVDECTIDEGTCGHYVTREVEGTALPHQLPESGNYNDDATCLADGTQTVYCKDCGEAVVIPAPGTKRTYHSYTNYVANNDGTCMVDGTMTAVCDWCHENASTVLNPEDTKEINKDNHLYGEYIYNNDATCLADGTQTRYCIHEDAQGAVCGHADETVTAEGTMIEHDWSEYVYNNDETCQNNGTETATCPGVAEANGVAPECGAQDTREVEGTKLDHHVFEEDAYVLTTEATCTTPGYETAPCKYAYDGCTETHTRLNPEKYPINPDNHDYAKPVYQEDATCVTDGTQTRKCKRDGCGFILTETAPGTAGQGTHIWGEYVANNDADCVHDGTMTANCIADPNCTAKDTVINPNDPAGKKAHTWGEYVYNNDATCVKDGTKTATCTVDGCGATDTEKDTDHLKSTVPHTYTEWKSNNDATCTADGTKTRECTADRCYHTETVKDEGTMKPHAWGEYKYNNDATYLADGTKTAKCTTCTATNTITAAGTKTPLKTIVNTASKFVDVKAGAWYKNAVDYAVTYGLISGTTATTFEPNGTITRGMFVTILARAAGVDTSAAANKAAKTQFTDVAAGKYYAAAIAWASSKQIVAGMTNTEFAPDAPIARQQLAVMIYRFASSQGVTLKAKKTVSFADAATVSTWAKDGVAACAAAGIVNGYTENGKTYFKPYKTATRAEATQMMYMFHAEYITGTIK